MVASQLLLAPGDRVVTVTPLWPNAVEKPKIMGGQVTCVSLEVRDGQWALPLEKLLQALTPDTRLLVLNSPNNPTGWTIHRAEQRAILEHCRRHGIWILADDVYERLIFSDGMRSAPSFLTMADDRDRLIVVNSFSNGNTHWPSRTSSETHVTWPPMIFGISTALGQSGVTVTTRSPGASNSWLATISAELPEVVTAIRSVGMAQ